MDAKILNCLRDSFGLTAFREGQYPVVSAILQGQSTLAVMPTGRGKSLCYQLPAVLLPGTALVVSPLIALMKDQVDALLARGIAASYINSALSSDEQAHRLEELRQGAYRVLYVAPERFRQRAFVEALKHVKISLFAVDEAHCLSQWGHDFRPDYLRLRQAWEACGEPPVLAATATATREVRNDIVTQLGLQDPVVVVSGFDRPNLRYVVRHTPSDESKMKKTLEVLARVPGAAIVYAATRKHVEEVTEALVAGGVSAVSYHAGMSDESRERAQDDFMQGHARVVVATNAFGMGIDKSDVRVVIHYDVPGTIEAYYQEAGRAGRDGKPAFCVLLFSPADRYLQEFFIEGSCPNARTIAAVYDVLINRSEEHIYLSQEAINRLLPHKAHDMAIGTALLWLERASLIERLPRGIAVAEVTLLRPDVPVGRSSIQERIVLALQAQADTGRPTTLDLGTFAAELKESRDALSHALLALRAKGIVHYEPPARTRGIKILRRVKSPLAYLDVSYIETKQARELARLDDMVAFAYSKSCRRNVILGYFGEQAEGQCGRCDVCSDRSDPAMDTSRDSSRSRVSKRPVTANTADAGGVEAELYELLSGLRSRLARENEVPPYLVFNNETLRELATTPPSTLDAMLAVRGIGREKLARYGSEFLGAILAYSARQKPGPAPSLEAALSQSPKARH
ncbi:MAG: ATP-dependent DNA helicase RecQ [Candidatus Sericytochromatia bacterium]|nr:ATP-dependent DNA helicase RecQ [Candidatus Sericytochromatia bacterium]